MNTLKPMLTVVLLAGIGVVLYFKINQTPPVLPDGTSDEFLEAPTLDFVGVDDAGSDPGEFAPLSEPQRPTALTESARFGGGGDPPAWNPPMGNETSVGVDGTPSAQAAPAAAGVSAEVPRCPRCHLRPKA